MTTGDLRRLGEQGHTTEETAFIHTSGRTGRLETGGDIVTSVRPLKLVSEQQNIYSRRCGAMSLKI